METVEKRMNGLEKEVRAKKKEAVKELEILTRSKELLQKGKLLIECPWNKEESKILNSFQLLTFKKRLYLFNGKEEEIPAEATEFDATAFKPEERSEFDLPQELTIDSLIKESYHLLGLITFLTTGPDETRAWTLKKGNTAPQAGGVIHSDFEKYFIKAEIIYWQELVDAGGFAKARESGLMRTEGKEYVVRDGDVIEIKSKA